MHKRYLCVIIKGQMLSLTKTIYNQDVFFILLLVSFLLIALIKGLYWKHARLLFMSVFAQRYANQYLREDNAFTERVNLLTFLLMTINFTLIIVKFQEIIDLWEIVFVSLIVAVFFLLKLICVKTLGFLFKFKSLARLTIFFSLLFDRALGFVLSPLILCMYFFSFDIVSSLLVTSLVLVMILLILKLFWLWKIGTKSFGLPQGYIFLYVCKLEIFPLLLLVKGVIY